MSKDTYPSGPDLSGHFSPPTQHKDVPLPAQFDNRCKKCHEPMKRMRVSLWTERKPYAQFHCVNCSLTLYIFEAPRKPFLMWSDTLCGVIHFSEFVGEEVAKRERDHVRDLARERADKPA